MALNGAISAVQVDQNSARVRLSVELLEPLSGEVVGTGQAEGQVRSQDPLPRDQLVEQALRRAAQTVMQGVGRTPLLVGQVAVPEAGKPLTVVVSRGTKLQIKSVLLLMSDSVEGPAAPVAAVVENLSGNAARVKILGQRHEPAGGELAISVGRLQ
jgi:hypothetical protein